MMANRNRTAGHKWELEVIKDLKESFPDCCSSRAESRNLDAAGVDICYTGNYHIQCKNSKSRPDYHKLISGMPNDKIRVVAHNYTQKASKNFITVGKYAVLPYEDLILMMHDIEALKEQLKNKE